MLSILLSEYNFTFAHSLKEAFPSIRNQQFDLIILDNWLPDGSGMELCREIRLSDFHTPIIFTSALGRKKDIEEAFDAGADKYMVKPCEPEILQKVVKELITRNGKL